MRFDFGNIDLVQQIVLRYKSDSSAPHWKKDIVHFIDWYLNKTGGLFQHTSGSTGIPKEILLPRDLLEASANATINFFQLKSGNSALLCIPVKYIGGKMMIVRAILGKWNLECIEPSLVLADMPNDQHVDFAAMIPLQVKNILNSSINGLQMFKHVIIGGAPVDIELEKLIIRSESRSYSTYGMTETASHVALKKLDGQSEFTALDGVTFDVDPDSRLIINSSRILPSPLFTNDVVQLLSDTSFKWLGRFDNVINSSGIKIVAEELEKRIAPYVKKSFYIIKQEHLKYGETPILVIEGEEDSLEKKEILLNTLKRILPEFWSPTNIRYKKQFEKTESGKVIRK